LLAKVVAGAGAVSPEVNGPTARNNGSSSPHP